jgi:hypothetical protein
VLALIPRSRPPYARQDEAAASDFVEWPSPVVSAVWAPTGERLLFAAHAHPARTCAGPVQGTRRRHRPARGIPECGERGPDLRAHRTPARLGRRPGAAPHPGSPHRPGRQPRPRDVGRRRPAHRPGRRPPHGLRLRPLRPVPPAHARLAPLVLRPLRRPGTRPPAPTPAAAAPRAETASATLPDGPSRAGRPQELNKCQHGSVWLWAEPMSASLACLRRGGGRMFCRCGQWPRCTSRAWWPWLTEEGAFVLPSHSERAYLVGPRAASTGGCRLIEG